MREPPLPRRLVVALARALPLIALVVATIAATATSARAEAPADETQTLDVDPEIVRRLHDLDPGRISARDVNEVLARVPAPRIILLQGSIPIVNMDPFAEFLIAMGYPADRIRNPRDGRYSESSFTDSQQLAGMVAWYYETEGMRPVLIGHSQGGMLAIRVLYDLAGAFSEAIHVWNPLTDRPEPRTTIVDPVTGDVRPVVGLRMRYAAAIATGKLPRLFLGQWSMLSRLSRIPDSVDDFTGYSLDWDFIAGHFGSAEPFTAIGTATVRNVTLPGSYTHVGLPRTEHLAGHAATRAWIDAYVPGANVAVPEEPGVDTTNLLHAADIWYSVKKNWCLSARRRLDPARVTQ
jgi:hypothetical protein